MASPLDFGRGRGFVSTVCMQSQWPSAAAVLQGTQGCGHPGTRVIGGRGRPWHQWSAALVPERATLIAGASSCRPKRVL